AHRRPVGWNVRAVGQLDLGVVAVLVPARNDGAGPDLPPRLRHVLGVGARDRGEVGDRSLGGMQAGYAADVRLDLRELGRVEPSEPRYAIRGRALLQTSERLELGLVLRYHDLAAGIVGKPPLGAEIAQEREAAPAQAGLE